MYMIKLHHYIPQLTTEDHERPSVYLSSQDLLSPARPQEWPWNRSLPNELFRALLEAHLPLTLLPSHRKRIKWRKDHWNYRILIWWFSNLKVADTKETNVVEGNDHGIACITTKILALTMWYPSPLLAILDNRITARQRSWSWWSLMGYGKEQLHVHFLGTERPCSINLPDCVDARWTIITTAFLSKAGQWQCFQENLVTKDNVGQMRFHQRASIIIFPAQKIKICGNRWNI